MKAFRFLVLLTCLLALTAPAMAMQQRRDPVVIEKRDRYPSQMALKHVNAIPQPVEPVIPKVEFLKSEEPRTLAERIDRLVAGITIDMPSEYDYYGYEIRRYMAHIGGPDVYANPARIREELNNVKKAKIILDYWQQDLNKEIYALEKAIDSEEVMSSDLLTVMASFKYNRSVVSAFLIECEGWIERNQNLLQFLVDREGLYTYSDPVFKFEDHEDKMKFMALYEAREKAFSFIVERAPFSIMVY